MSPMACHVQGLELSGSAGTDTHDITPQVLTAVSQSGVRAGLVTVHAPGSTAAVTTIEHEPTVLADLRQALERLAALSAYRPGKRVFLPGLPGAGAPGGPSLARFPGRGQAARLIATCCWAPGSRSWCWIWTTGPATGAWSFKVLGE